MVDAEILAQWVVNVGRRDGESRLAHLFCELATRFGADQGPHLSYHLPLTQQHIGDATGMTAVHTNRILRALREQGAVSIKDRQVQIQDWIKLVRIGGFDPEYLRTDVQRPERLLN